MKKYIDISFGVIRDNLYDDLPKDEINIIKNGIKFTYNNETTIRDLFLKLNKIFNGINNKQEEIPHEQLTKDSSLQFLYRIRCREELMYIFDLNITINELVKFIGNNNIVIALTLFRGIGGEVHRENGFKFFMHTREGKRHHDPHIHVIQGADEIRVDLLTLETYGKMKKQYRKRAVEIVKYNRQSFLFKWNTITDGDKVEFTEEETNRVF